MKLSYGILSLSLLASALACAPEKKFSTKVDTAKVVEKAPATKDVIPEGPKPVTNTIHFSKILNGKLTEPYPVKSGSLDISFDLNTVTAITEKSTIRPPIDVTFVLDITSSMGVQLEVSKTNFKKFLERLKMDGFDARFSLLTFEDNVKVDASFTDFDSFQASLSKVKLGDGQDIAEASLLALQNALTDAEKNRRMDAIPVVIIVTDAVGHNGGGSSFARDCTLDKTVASFGSDYGKSSIFFYAAPSPKIAKSGAGCYSLPPNEQYGNLFTQISAQTTDKMAFRGQALGWPFKEETLTTELPNLLKEKISPKALGCKATKFSVSESGKQLVSADASKWKLDAKGNPTLADLFSGDELEALIGKSLTVEVVRCCDETKDATSCKNEQKQSVEFELSKG